MFDLRERERIGTESIFSYSPLKELKESWKEDKHLKSLAKASKERILRCEIWDVGKNRLRSNKRVQYSPAGTI